MILGKCKNPNCTVATTGICLESHTIVKECPNYFEEEEIHEEISELTTLDPGADINPRLLQPIRQFHSGFEVGFHDVVPIMLRRYTHLVGILGSSNVGKTCLLASLYLLASHGELLPEYYFDGSLTLQGFEERVRGLRKWEEGRLPEQLVEHTRLQDPRRPAFMHLCIKENRHNGRWIDLLMTDLPGEWTDNMIDQQSAINRLNFLERADGIIYVIDGMLVNSIENQHREVYRATVAIDRLFVNILKDRHIPLIFVISKCDEIDMQYPNGVQQIAQHAEQYGLKVNVVLTAAISKKPDCFSSGTGVLDAFKFAINPIGTTEKSIRQWHPLERSFWSFAEQ